jgi:hypothetical protein
MKVMKNIVGKKATPAELIQYVLSKDGVASGVIGHVGMETLVDNIRIVTEYAEAEMAHHEKAEIEQRLAHLAGPHALVWARPDYYDGMMC